MAHRRLSILALAAATLCVRAQPLYPTVAKAEQVKRDTDRRLILETELVAEHDALVKSKAAVESNPTRDREIEVHRHEENIKALQRELDSTTNNDAARNPKRVLVKAQHPTSGADNTKGTGRFWEPYNRAPDTADFSTSPRRDSHE